MLSRLRPFAVSLTRRGLRGAVRSTAPEQVEFVRPTRDIAKVVGFTVVASGAAFGIGSVVEYERWKSHQIRQRSFYDFITEKKRHPFYDDIFGRNENDAGLRAELRARWNKLSIGEKTFGVIAFANSLVFVAWQIPQMNRFMSAWFYNGFHMKNLCLPLLLSTHSHSNFIHFGLNMITIYASFFKFPLILRYVLSSFAPLVIDHWMRSSEHMIAFYTAAGMVSSCVAVVHKAVIGSRVVALGASGAILGLLIYACAKMPDNHLQIVFLPMFSFTAQNAIYGVMAFDIIGLVLRWRMFDHAAHLGGALFGLWYAHYGERLIWDNRNVVVERWRSFRGDQ